MHFFHLFPVTGVVLVLLAVRCISYENLQVYISTVRIFQTCELFRPRIFFSAALLLLPRDLRARVFGRPVAAVAFMRRITLLMCCFYFHVVRRQPQSLYLFLAEHAFKWRTIVEISRRSNSASRPFWDTPPTKKDRVSPPHFVATLSPGIFFSETVKRG